MSRPFDILGIGAVAVDELHRVSGYPLEDTKVRVLSHERRFGGLVGNALTAAARLGARCAYAGVLGDDTDSSFVREALEREGIDQSSLLHDPAAHPFHGTIIINEASGSRTVLSQLACPGTTPLKWLPPARVVLIDHHCPAAACVEIGRLRDQGSQVVADLERSHERSPELEALADHLIVPLSYACTRSGYADPQRAAVALWAVHRRLVAVTDGAAGCWFTEDGEVAHQGVYDVDAIETNGCGDVFHGAYAWSLLHGWGVHERMRRASAAAAVKASGRGLSALRGSADVEALLVGGHARPSPAAAGAQPRAITTATCQSRPPLVG